MYRYPNICLILFLFQTTFTFERVVRMNQMQPPPQYYQAKPRSSLPPVTISEPPMRVQTMGGYHVQAQQAPVISRVREERVVEAPPPESRIQYVPYDCYYTDFEERQVLTTVRVPVQRKFINYYTVEHVTEYMPKEREEVVVEMVPEERVNMRLQYVPVETKVVHYPKGDGTMGVKMQDLKPQHQVLYQQNVQKSQQIRQLHPSSSSYTLNSQKKSRVSLPKTRYVTSDDYVPMDHYELPEQILQIEKQQQSRLTEKQQHEQ